MIFIGGNQLHWMIYEKAPQCRVQLSRWTHYTLVHAAVRQLLQCLDADGGHFETPTLNPKFKDISHINFAFV